MTDWDGSFDQLAHASSFPAWVAVLTASFFALIFLLSLLRAERNLANGALAAITFTGLAIAAAVGLRTPSVPERLPALPSIAGIPALACIDDLAGDATLAACEKSLFAAPETVAAAVAYTGARINRLVALGHASNANRIATPDEQSLRNSIEHDRYGLVAYVLTARDKCQPDKCAAFSVMSDHRQVASNMDGLIYEGLVARYAPNWPANDAGGGVMVSSQPAATGKPSSIDFPTAASIPPVSIMTPEPGSRSIAPADQPTPDGPSSTTPVAGTGGPYVPAADGAATRRRSGTKRPPGSSQGGTGPVQLTPSAQ